MANCAIAEGVLHLALCVAYHPTLNDIDIKVTTTQPAFSPCVPYVQALLHSYNPNTQRELLYTQPLLRRYSQ
eukprot:5896313-Pyramimonas_sp.AAC.2